MESIKEILFHLFQAIAGFGLQGGIPVEINSFKTSNKLFYQLVPFYSGVTTRFDEICYMLLRVTLTIKLGEFI